MISKKIKQRLHRFVLHAVIFSACCAVIGVVILSIIAGRAAAIDHAEDNAENLAISLARQLDDTFKMADATLGPMVDLMEGAARIDPEKLHALVLRQLGRSDRIQGIFVYDEHGNWVLSPKQEGVALANNSDRDYFVFHQNHDDDQSYVGKPILSRMDGERILTISRRFNKPDDTFGGVVLISFKTSYFEALYQQFDLGPQGLINLVNSDGVVLLSSRLNNEVAQNGDQCKSDATRTTWQASSVSAKDRHRNLIIAASAPVPPYDLCLVVGLDGDEALSTMPLLITMGAVGGGLIVMLLLGAALWLDRKLIETLGNEIKLIEESRTDALTLVANRRAFDNHLAAMLQAAPLVPTMGSILLIDVDHFKGFNDRYGHQEGDECLRRVAHELSSIVHRPEDLVARYGGEEFVLLFERTPSHEAEKILEGLRADVETCEFFYRDKQVKVTVSFGLSTLRPGEDLETLFIRADEAMYQAKRAGRNRVIVL